MQRAIRKILGKENSKALLLFSHFFTCFPHSGTLNLPPPSPHTSFSPSPVWFMGETFDIPSPPLVGPREKSLVERERERNFMRFFLLLSFMQLYCTHMHVSRTIFVNNEFLASFFHLNFFINKLHYQACILSMTWVSVHNYRYTFSTSFRSPFYSAKASHKSKLPVIHIPPGSL